MNSISSTPGIQCSMCVSSAQKRKRTTNDDELLPPKQIESLISTTPSTECQACRIETEDVCLRKQKLDELTEKVDESTTSVSSLPDEVLVEIFIKLSLRDRKSVRAVCRRWFDVSISRNKLCREEKLVYRCYYNFDDIVEIMESSLRQTWHLELCRIDTVDNSFWINNGPKIEWLLFTDCYPSGNQMKYILRNCTKLECLSIVLNGPRLQNRISLTYDDELIDAQKLRRESLCSLEITSTGQLVLSKNFYPNLLAICPNLRNITLSARGGVYSCPDPFNAPCIMSYGTAIFRRKLIDLQMVLKSIHLDGGETSFSNEIWNAIKSLHFPNLKSITVVVDLRFAETELQNYLEFFSRHKQLQSVRIMFQSKGVSISSITTFSEKLLRCLFDLCIHLQSLMISASSNMRVSDALVKLDASLTSKMKASRLKFFGIQSIPVKINVPSDKIINYNLEKLILRGPIMTRDTILSVCKPFCGLAHLDVILKHEEDLQNIIQYLHNLKTLTLRKMKNFTDYAFTGHCSDEENNENLSGYSIRTLSKLQCLKLRLEDALITRTTLMELKFLNNLSVLDISSNIPLDKYEDSLCLEVLFGPLKKLEVLKITEVFQPWKFYVAIERMVYFQ